MKDKKVKTNNENLEENNLSSNSLDEDREYDSDDTLPATPIDGIAQSNIRNTDYVLVEDHYEWKRKYVHIDFVYDGNGIVTGQRLISDTPNPQYLTKKKKATEEQYQPFKSELEEKLWEVYEQNHSESVEDKKLLGKRKTRESDANNSPKMFKANNIGSSFEGIKTAGNSPLNELNLNNSDKMSAIDLTNLSNYNFSTETEFGTYQKSGSLDNSKKTDLDTIEEGNHFKFINTVPNSPSRLSLDANPEEYLRYFTPEQALSSLQKEIKQQKKMYQNEINGLKMHTKALNKTIAFTQNNFRSFVEQVEEEKEAKSKSKSNNNYMSMFS